MVNVRNAEMKEAKESGNEREREQKERKNEKAIVRANNLIYKSQCVCRVCLL